MNEARNSAFRAVIDKRTGYAITDFENCFLAGIKQGKTEMAEELEVLRNRIRDLVFHRPIDPEVLRTLVGE